MKSLVKYLIPLCITLTQTTFADTQHHPFVFYNTKTIERAKTNSQSDPGFKQLAEGIIRAAKRGNLDQLPDLSSQWYQTEIKIPFRKRDNSLYYQKCRLNPLQYSNLAKNCAQAYLLTNDNTFIVKGKNVLLKLSQYDFEPDQVDSGLNYTVGFLPALEAYDVFYNACTPDEHKTLDDLFDRMVRAVMRDDDYWLKNEPGGKINNHFTWHSACYAAVGLFYNRQDLIHRAYFEQRGFVYMLDNGFQDGGLWLEGSLPYGFVQFDAMLFMAELASNADYKVDFWNYQNAKGLTLKKIYDEMITLLFPDGLLPPIGDGYGRLHKPGNYPVYEKLYTKFRDDKYAWLIRHSGKRNRHGLLFSGVIDLPEIKTPPAQFSKLWPEHAFVALRSNQGQDYWSGKGWTLFAYYGTNLCHHHYDKLSTMLYGDGRLWLRDTEATPIEIHPFSSDVNKTLNCATLSHNTVMIDKANQPSALKGPLDLIEYSDQPPAQSVTFADLNENLYKGVRQMRTCIVRDEFVLDVFQVIADRKCDIDYTLHIDADPIPQDNLSFQPYTLPQQGAWKYIKNAKISPIDTHVSEQFQYENKRFAMDIFTDSPAHVIHCGFPLSNKENPKFMPMRMININSDHALFVVVFRTGPAVDAPLDVNFRQADETHWNIDASLNDKSFAHTIPKLQ